LGHRLAYEELLKSQILLYAQVEMHQKHKWKPIKGIYEEKDMN
jgi:hypothetical protein